MDKTPILTEDEVQKLLEDIPKIRLDKTLLTGSLIDTDEFISKYFCKPVTSYQIYFPGTNVFHEHGLFSEKIFGNVISVDRFKRFGYIDLNTKILQPPIFFILLSLKTLYGKILNSSNYAIFDENEKDFILGPVDDENSKTGYEFFISHLYDLKIKKPDSLNKRAYWEVFNKYQKKGLLTTDKLLVLPAGLREISTDTVKLSRDTINQMYLNVLALSKGIDPEIGNLKIYDRLRSNIQNKIFSIWNYLINIISGDNGYIQDKFGDRIVFFGTSNVIATDNKIAGNPNDATNIKPNESVISLVQCAKEYQPILIHYLLRYFNEYINVNSKSHTLTNIKTYKKENGYLDSKMIQTLTSQESLEGLINSLKYESFKNSPIIITDVDGNKFTTVLVYDLENIIIYSDNKNHILEKLNELDESFDNNKLRPITWGELVYVILYLNIEKPGNNYGFTVRYPAIQEESNRPLKIKIYTTAPSRKILLYGPGFSELFPSYPVVGNKYNESMSINSLCLGGYSGDFDGDMMSSNGVYFEESKKEIDLYYKTINSIINNDGDFMYYPEYTHELIVKALSFDETEDI